LPRTAPLSSCTVLPELTGILRSFVKAMLLRSHSVSRDASRPVLDRKVIMVSLALRT